MILNMGSGLSLTAGQMATISPQAVEYLRKLPKIPFADFLAPFLTSPNRIHSFRANFEKAQRPVAEAIIAKYDLKLKTIMVADVLVVMIEPPIIEAKNAERIILNIHGGAFVLYTIRAGRSSTLLTNSGASGIACRSSRIGWPRQHALDVLIEHR